jgi:hypothetical protein
MGVSPIAGLAVMPMIWQIFGVVTMYDINPWRSPSRLI